MSQRGYHTAEDSEDEGTTRGASVLVADDDPTSRLLVGATLEGHVGKVVEAANGALAVEALATNSFDIAIMDLHMPVLDGFGFIERARARAETRHLPIIVVTGRDDVVAIERAFALGATSFLCKPLNWSVFRHQVRYVLKVARAEREMRLAKERAERIAAFRGHMLAALEKEIGGAVGAISEFVAASAAMADQAALAELATSGERLSSALRKVHRVSGIVTGEAVLERERVRAADVAADAMRRTADALGIDAAARIELAGAVDRELFCDRRLAAVALSEVLQNALAYSPADKKVKMTVVEAPPDRIRFEIEDRGPGIPEDMLAGGPDELAAAGFGIPTARMIAERHGGHLGIMSEIGRGSEVFLGFPAYRISSKRDESLNETATNFGTKLARSAHISGS